MNDATQRLLPVLDDLATVLDGIPSDRDAHPTPCEAFTVSDLRQHVLGWLTAFTDGFESPDGTCSDPEAVEVEGTGAEQVRTLADRLEEALDADAASRPLVIGGADMPGEMALDMIVGEYQVHGWDLATATGQAWRPADEGLEHSLTFFDAMLTPDYQGEGKSFHPRVDVADDAPAIDRLVAMTGRDPQWAPPRT